MQRIAVWLSLIAVLLAAATTLYAMRLVGTAMPGRGILYLALTLSETIVAALSVRSKRPTIAWAMTGCVCGFVFIGSASFGLLFLPSTVLLLGAAISSSFAMTVNWRSLRDPLFLIGGASATAALVFVVSASQGSRIATAEFASETAVVPPPAVIVGSRVFASLVVVAAVWAITTRLRSNRQPGNR